MKRVIHLTTALALILGSSALFAMGMDDASITKDDASITKDVQAKITTMTNIPTVTAPNLVVVTKEGTVMVTGIVETSAQKKDVEKVAKEVTGVKDVKFDIKVQAD